MFDAGPSRLPSDPKNQAKPLMVLTYTQMYEVEGQGTYEVKVTNLLNPNTLR